jgi:hypothetical protein
MEKKRLIKNTKIFKGMKRRKNNNVVRLKCLSLSLMMIKKSMRMASYSLNPLLGYLMRLLHRTLYSNKFWSPCNSDAIMIVVSYLHSQLVMLLK